MRRYRPFLVFNPAKGWAFYPNPGVSSFTRRTLGSKAMRPPIGWFVSAELAAIFEHRHGRS